MFSHLENCLRFKFIAVDTEGFTADTILGVSVAHPGLEGMYFPIGHREHVNIDMELARFLVYVLETVEYRVFQHAGHDTVILPFLSDLPFACTMIMAHMIDENVMSKSLDYLGKYYCDEGKVDDSLMQSIIKTHGWDWVPYELMRVYATQDAVLTMKLFLQLLPLYERQYGALWS